MCEESEELIEGIEAEFHEDPIDPSTVKQYVTRVKGIHSSFRRWAVTMKIERPTWADFIRYLHLRRDTVISKSWRLYRAALVYVYTANGRKLVVENILQISTSGCLKRKRPRSKDDRRTSEFKLKSLPISMQEILTSELRTIRGRGYRSAQFAADMIDMIVICGLRPKECRTVEFVEKSREGTPALIVENAKFKKFRAHGPIRTVHLTAVPDGSLQSLREFIVRTRSYYALGIKKYERLYDCAQDAVRRVSEKLWKQRKRRPCIYSGRHQFIANAKAAGLSWLEIAAIVGHATDKTARAHYARKAKGSKGAFLVSADGGDVKRIRQVYKAPDFEALRKKSSLATSKKTRKAPSNNFSPGM